MPDDHERGSRDGEASAEAEPKTDGAHLFVEGEQDANGQADQPVADDLDDEAGVGVAEAAQGSGSGDLQAVEELEGGGD